jgi:hypothetical protein
MRVRVTQIRPPLGTLPAVVPAETLLGRSAQATVHLSRLWVYPTGFQFQLLVDLADPWSELDPFQFGLRRRGREPDPASPERLHFGFAFADGTEATNVRSGHGVDRESSTPKLSGMGASSGGGHAHSSFWLWPLPPPGPIEAFCEWRAAGLELSRTELDGEAIAAAAGRARRIFEDKEMDGQA